jgi:hypothetical protein
MIFQPFLPEALTKYAFVELPAITALLHLQSRYITDKHMLDTAAAL